MDLSSTAGIVAGLVAVSTVVVKYLDGWQKFEARLDDASAPGAPAEQQHPAPPVEPPVPQPPILVPVPVPDEDLEAEIADVPSPPDDDDVDAITDEVVLGDVLADEEERHAA